MNPNANVSLFNFNGHDVRVVEIDGEPWFRGADLLTNIYGTSQGKAWAYRPLNPSEITMIDRINLGMKAGRALTFVSESGLYKMVMRSDKPEARQFQDWVTREVLPSIRKDGGYVLGERARCGILSTPSHLLDHPATPPTTTAAR
ncbi:BRO-N domain-containing protein [Shinella sumterensis]|uniref:BRO-N domain-containing protein n=1 Tax=Shinella sumterensis TaxID=1967501 RepID=UPI003F878EE0